MTLHKSFDFLVQLSLNNNREWFNENKSQYLSAKEEFEQFVALLIPKTAELDTGIQNLEAKDCVFRIYRDARFSKDKTPYKNHFGAYISRGGRKSKFGGFYLHIEPDNSFLAGGLHALESADLKKVRTAILESPEDYKAILMRKGFRDCFGELKGEQLKTAPRGFPKDFPDLSLLRNKQHYVMHAVSDEIVQSDGLMAAVLSVFSEMQPLNEYLNAIINE